MQERKKHFGRAAIQELMRSHGWPWDSWQTIMRARRKEGFPLREGAVRGHWYVFEDEVIAWFESENKGDENE